MATQGLLSHPEGVTRSILRRWPSLTLRVSPSDWHRGVRQLPSRATQQQSQDSNPGSLEPGPKLLIMPDLLLGQHQPTAVSILGCVSWATGCTEQFYLFLKTTLPTFVSILQMRKLRVSEMKHWCLVKGTQNSNLVPFPRGKGLYTFSILIQYWIQGWTEYVRLLWVGRSKTQSPCAFILKTHTQFISCV